MLFGSTCLEYFPNPLLWIDVYSWFWGVFLRCTRRMDPVFKPIFLVYVFLLENWYHWYWEIWMTDAYWFLFFAVVVCCVCECVHVSFHLILLVWDYFQSLKDVLNLPLYHILLGCFCWQSFFFKFHFIIEHLNFSVYGDGKLWWV